MSTSPDACMSWRGGGMVRRAGFLQRMVSVTLLAMILAPTALSHLGQLPCTRRVPSIKSLSVRLRGGSDVDSDHIAEDMFERQAYHVEASEFAYSSVSNEEDLFESPAAIADQETQDRVVGLFMAKSGLNFAVARTVLAGFNWDLERAVDVHFGRVDPKPLPGEAGYDGDHGARIYSPREMIDYENIDEIVTVEKQQDSPGLVTPKEVRMTEAARERGVHRLRCDMLPTSGGNAANGVMFDVAAVSGDVLVVGLQACADVERQSEYSVFFTDGSWLDEGFATCTNRSKWKRLMRERTMMLADNPMEELPDGNVRLAAGNYTSLPFDLHPQSGKPMAVRIACGERKAFYVHGRRVASVMYRHLVRDLNITEEEAFGKNGLATIWGEDMSTLQYMYNDRESKPILIDSDAHI
ncbi:hypothetical protein T484DRAFT_1929987, partial [Baffinella frigidus]